jgi:hypothetical protein
MNIMNAEEQRDTLLLQDAVKILGRNIHNSRNTILGEWLELDTEGEKFVETLRN